MAPRFDRGREDEVMRLAGKEYKKGVSLTSRTELVYKLPARVKRFQALAGIDDRVGNLGSVQLVITATTASYTQVRSPARIRRWRSTSIWPACGG